MAGNDEYSYTSTNQLITERFDDIETYTDNALSNVLAYTENLQALLDSLTLPNTDDIEDIILPNLTTIDYAALPTFSQLLDNFPSFDNVLDPMEDLTPLNDISVDIPQKNFNFVLNNYDAPDIDIGTVPEAPSTSSITLPVKPELTFPDVPSLDDIVLKSPPIIDLGSFDAIAPSLEDQEKPNEFKYNEASYSSDIRLPLFNKILYDIANGGTGLDVDVEEDIYARGVERQRVENERLYDEIQNQFSATGFNLPSGAYASRLLAVSNEISRKNDQLNRDVTISQAELAQNNTQFTTQQAVALEQMLVGFFNEQQNRTLQASQITAANAIEIYNAVLGHQRLLLENYQTEANVFETKIRAELNAVEIYKAEIEAARAKTEVNQARVNIYNAQLNGLNTIMQVYATEMESAKIQATIQQLEVDIFRARTQAYVASVDAEKSKIDIYIAQMDSEKIRADVFKTTVDAYQTEISAKLSELEAAKLVNENILQNNQLKLEEYRTKVTKYQAEIDAEIKTAQLTLTGYEVEAGAYTAQVNAKGMEFESRIKETQSKIELFKAQLAKATSVIDSTSQSYIALKDLQIKATEGIMNTNAQIAASAMNAVNASANQSASYSNSDSESESYSEIHSFNY